MVSIIQNELPTIVAGGAFGENVDFVLFELNKDLVGTNQYMSQVVFGTVITSDESRYEVLVKLNLDDENTRKSHHIDEQFYNEITMYEKIIPFLLSNYGSLVGNAVAPSISRYFYGCYRNEEYGHNDLIILENVKPLGYSLSEERIFLDYKHLLNMIQSLAKFHALSYTAKHKNPTKFREIISDIVKLHPSEWHIKNNGYFKYIKRGVDGLLSRNGSDLYRNHENLRWFNEPLRIDQHFLQPTLEPREPFSVVCHGDFNRNNVLFRYDEAGNPVDALLFDFGTPHYGSPVVDLSFFLYMNTTQSTRVNRWDDLLDAYCSTVATSVPSGVRVPSRIELDSEMARCAVYGLGIAAFFLPHQLRENEIVDTTDDDDVTVEKLLQFGGAEGTERVADMVQHFIDMGYTLFTN